MIYALLDLVANRDPGQPSDLVVDYCYMTYNLSNKRLIRLRLALFESNAKHLLLGSLLM